MADKKNGTKAGINYNRNPKGCPENLLSNKYHVQEIYDEVEREIDVEDYDCIVSWALKQPFSKVKFCVDKATDLPVIVKTVCSALLSDIKYGRIQTTQMALERLKGKPVERSVVQNVDLTPQLVVEVSNPQVENNLQYLIAKDEDNKNVREDS